MVAAAHTWPAGLGSLVRVHSQGGSCKHDLSLDSQTSVGAVSTLLLDRVDNIEETSNVTMREAPAACDSADLGGDALSGHCGCAVLPSVGFDLPGRRPRCVHGRYCMYLRCLTRAAVALLV